jgi:LacI family transcriptional regulator
LVLASMEKLATGPRSATQSRAKRLKFSVILPLDAGESTEILREKMLQQAAIQGVEVDVILIEKLDPYALAHTLLSSAMRKYSGIAFRGVDHSAVQSAVSKLSLLGIPTVSLVTGVSHTGGVRFVGLDNRAAGRTAGYLIGRFLPNAGQVAVLWGGEMLVNQEMREIGFRSILRSQFPHLEVLDPVSSRDDADESYVQVRALLDRYPNMTGLYNVGGGTKGIVKALKEAGRASSVVMVNHNLTSITKEFLIDGAIDALIQQDMQRTAEVAISELILSAEGIIRPIRHIPIEVIFKENLSSRL